MRAGGRAGTQKAVIYLGMRANRMTGIKTLLVFGPQISNSAATQPDGLLRQRPS